MALGGKQTGVLGGELPAQPSTTLDLLRSEDAEWDEWLTLFASRNEVAAVYADMLRKFSADDERFFPVNRAILRRWSPYGLDYIKGRAWKIASQEVGVRV